MNLILDGPEKEKPAKKKRVVEVKADPKATAEAPIMESNVMTREQWLAWVERQRQKEAADIEDAQLEIAAPIWRSANA